MRITRIRLHTSALSTRHSGMLRRCLSQRGTALLEAAVTIPILLLIAVGIFEFGRAYQTWQVVTNAAREGARAGSVYRSNHLDIKIRTNHPT